MGILTDWYSPTEIKFWRVDFVFGLEHLELLSEGTWPPDPRGSGYTDSPGKHQINSKAPFIVPVEYAAEIKERLKACGADGEMARMIYSDGIPAHRVARLVKLHEDVVERRVETVIKYCASGQARRWITTKKRQGRTYQNWVNRPRKSA